LEQTHFRSWSLIWIAEGGHEGGWVVIGGALRAGLETDLPTTFRLARQYMVRADIWYGADILAERVPGPGLVRDFDQTLGLISVWCDDPSHWIRCAVGVAVHLWAKRSAGSPALAGHAAMILDSHVQRMFSEWEMQAAKGIGWGLKTLGKHYPGLMERWLSNRVGTKHWAMMLRKAFTYLSAGQRTRITAAVS
jgi:hypothetical protein